MATTAVPNGTFPVQFAPSALAELRGKKRAAEDELVAFRCEADWDEHELTEDAFKPASVNCDTPGIVENAEGSRVLSFDLPTGGSQVFNIREESSKSRECVLIWDEDSQSFTLHSLPTTLHLSQNRTLSAQRPAGGFPTPPPPEVKPKRAATAGKAAKNEIPAGATVIAPAKKKAPVKAKKPPAKAAAKKAAPKKGGKKTVAQPDSKVKSVEIIDDSDEGDDGMDEFADMLGAVIEEQTYDDEDDDDEDDVEEDENDELGGAHFAGYEAQAAGDDEEWI